MRRASLWLACTFGVVTSMSACMDLFHDTEFASVRAAAEAGPASSEDATLPGVRSTDFCSWTPVEARTHATHACAWLGACAGPLGESTFGPCMMHALWSFDCELNPDLRPRGTAAALWGCLADVRSCAEVDACLFSGARPTCAPVASGSFTTCAATGGGAGGDAGAGVLVACSRPEEGPPTGMEPCGLVGKTCTAIDEGTGRCTGGAGKGCALGASCDGALAVDCQLVGSSPIDFGLDCGAFGAGRCVAGDGGVACAPGETARPCATATPAPSCQGDLARVCVEGREIRVDCAKLGLSCDVATVPVSPLDPLRACVDRTSVRCASVDECVAGTLRSCAQGARFDVDCQREGLGPCEVTSDGRIARCAPL